MNRMEEQFRELLSHNKRYWYSYQSPLTCLLGSDGVGHDNIHPMDQLQAACRNALTMHDAVVSMREDLELKEIDVDEYTHRCERLSGWESRRNEVKLRQAKRSVEALKMQIAEREEAFGVFYAHAKALLPQITQKYDHIDQALPEMWAARVAYNAQVKNMPLGHEFKVALMTESQKREVFKQLGLPAEYHMPDAQAVISAVDKLAIKLRELPETNTAIDYQGAESCRNTEGYSSDRETRQITPD